MMKKLDILFPLLAMILVLNGCTKEVTLDIPGYEEQLVIDGQIETDQPPFVLISKSKEVYAPTDINAFLNGYITGATVTVSDGTTTVTLDELCSSNLPPGTEEIAAAMFGLTVAELANYNICAYTSFNTAIWGQVGKTYTLTVTYEGKTYTAETSIVQPTSFDDLYWKAEPESPNYGFSWVTLTDPANQYDAYQWEMKRINKNPDGTTIDAAYTAPFGPVFDDNFFDGLTFDFAYGNPNGNGPNVTDEQRWKYAVGDTVVIKFSKLDRNVFEYLEKKYTQLSTAGNPFATPTNLTTNIKGGALGLWAGYSPIFDTLACYP